MEARMTSKVTRAAKLLCVLSLPFLGQTQAAGLDAASARPDGLDRIFQKWDGTATPGCVLAVSQVGKPLAVRAYGMADLELGAAITPDTVFEAGSNSKQFVAASVELLARDGKLSLDDDVHKYLPELPSYGARLTLRDMLHHVSGLRDWGALFALQGWPRNSRAVSNQDVLSLAEQQSSLNFAPGTHYLYSNTNYNLAAIIVERVSGLSLSDFTRKRIFLPLGMSHTSWRTDHTRIVPGRAAGYDPSSEGYRNSRVIEDAYGNSGLLTTVADLLKWEAALDNNVFGADFTGQMQRPAALRDGRPVGYGLGLELGEYHGAREVSHPGWTAGYRSWTARYPDQKLALALLCNTSEVDTADLGRQVADLYLPPYRQPSPGVLGAPPSGLYADRLSGRPMSLRVDGDGRLRVDGTPASAVGRGRWRVRDDSVALAGKGLVRETPEGEISFYDPVTPVTRFQPSEYIGRFCAARIACMTIASDGRSLDFSGARWSRHTLDPAYRDVFMGQAMPGTSSVVLRFQRDHKGRVDGFQLADSQDYGVQFERVP
jgi:CubicO group peptidase (beta-lactamase class C family)